MSSSERRLRSELEPHWAADTSASPERWTPERPSLGQCAVTALLVQECLGGVLLRGVVRGESHYWNQLPDGSEVDLTRDQFDTFTLDGPVEERPRASVLSSPDTAERYGRLRRRSTISPPRLTVVPVELSDANEFVRRHHRHHEPVVGHKFSLGAVDDEGEVRGVAIVGRPVARGRQDGWTLEVTRLATDGCPNAASALYAACWRAVRAMGYRRLGTYTLVTEPGTSLRAAGWKVVGHVKGRSWDTPSRPRVDRHPTLDKQLWEAS